MDKLPPYIRLNRYQNRCTHTTPAVFNEWVKELVRAASRGVKHTSGRREVKHDNNIRQYDRKYAHQCIHSTGQTAVTTSQSVTTEGNNWRCSACGDGCPNVFNCCRFLGMSVSSRWTTIKRASLCRTCLRKHPGACSVTTLCGVNGCERRHHQLLHSSCSSQLLSDIPPELSRVNVHTTYVTWEWEEG